MDPKINERTDDELVLLFKSGSSDAFEELVYRYKNSLYQYIMAMVQDEGAAGDLFQEVFISLFKHADKYEPRGKFKSWLFLTARNRVLNFFRDRDKLASLDQTDEEGNAFLHDTLPDGQPSLLEELAGRETEEEIRRASLELPARQREMLYLRQYMSFKEIAQLLDRPLGTVLADCHRAVKKMQRILAEEQPAAREVTL
ncbi:RNA polymerase sigma factor [Candidatus Avelusimicrobium gallicola]|nr:RNA polymerase sigma factor [Elusimicrobium sp. An273]